MGAHPATEAGGESSDRRVTLPRSTRKPPGTVRRWGLGVWMRSRLITRLSFSGRSPVLAVLLPQVIGNALG